MMTGIVSQYASEILPVSIVSVQCSGRISQTHLSGGVVDGSQRLLIHAEILGNSSRPYEFSLVFDGDLRTWRGAITLIAQDNSEREGQYDHWGVQAPHIDDWEEQVVAAVTPVSPAALLAQINGQGNASTSDSDGKTWCITTAPRVDPVMIAMALEAWEAIESRPEFSIKARDKARGKTKSVEKPAVQRPAWPLPTSTW
jgi:hypothetical protein